MLFFLEKVRIFHDGYDPLDADDVKQWEKEKTLERTSNIFEFFFQHHSKGGKTKESHQTPFEELFRSFSGENSQRFRDQKTFEQQFKNSKEFVAQQEKERQKQAQEQKRQEEILKQQQLELQRHQEILMRQKQEQIRLEQVFKQQQEEKRQREILQRRKEQEERQERIRLQKLEEEERRQAEIERQEQMNYANSERSRTYSSQDRSGSNQESRYTGPLDGDSRERNRRFHDDTWRHESAADRQRTSSRSSDASHDYQQSERLSDRRSRSFNQDYTTQQRHQQDKARTYSQDSGYYDQRSSEFSKQQFRSSDSFESNGQKKKYIQGTDGRWYYKGPDGRWKVAEKPPNDPYKDREATRSNANPRSSQSSETYTDENGKVYVKGSDGNWYMRIEPPSKTQQRSEQQSYQQARYQHQPKSESYARSQQSQQHSGHFSQSSSTDDKLPRGLFRNDRGQVSDRIGNLYERLRDGRYRVVVTAAEAKERLKEQLRNHKQSDLLRHNRDPIRQHSNSKQQIFHDATGNVYVKDQQGNLIKVKPGHHGSKNPTPTEQATSAGRDGYSYKDPNVAWQQKRWHRPDQDESRSYRQQQQAQQQAGTSYHGSRDRRSSYSNRQEYQRRSYGHRPLHEEL